MIDSQYGLDIVSYGFLMDHLAQIRHILTNSYDKFISQKQARLRFVLELL